jgi:CPA1 family monovalent cation:H+ antiporter
VADLLHELVARRVEGVEQALEALKLQYPGYAEELERKFLRRTGLRLERQEIDDLRREGLIGPELHQSLTQGIEDRIARERKRPKLDLALRRAELARQVPLLSHLDEAMLKRLAKGFVTRHANAGEVIRRRAEAPRSVYFIASGAVEVTTAKQTNRLGRGEMFGQIALLAGRAYQGEVKAIAPTTLLVLDEARFMKILRAKKHVREAVLTMAKERGLSEAGLAKLTAALEAPAA